MNKKSLALLGLHISFMFISIGAFILGGRNYWSVVAIPAAFLSGTYLVRWMQSLGAEE